jgi:hypothetical protein
MVRLAAQTRVWCDRGRVILPRPGGAVFLPMPPLAKAARQCWARGRGAQDERLHQTLPDALHLSPLSLGTVSRPAQCVARRSALTRTISSVDISKVFRAKIVAGLRSALTANERPPNFTASVCGATAR